MPPAPLLVADCSGPDRSDQSGYHSGIIHGGIVSASSSATIAAGSARRVVVLGSTGSIGTSCLDVTDHLPDRLRVIGLSAHSSWQSLLDQVRRCRPRWAVLTDPEAARQATAN